MNELLLRRRMMNGEGGSIPYQRIEYLQSSGTQYIDTGIIPDVTTEVEIEVAFIETNSIGFFGTRKDPYRFSCTTFSSGANFAFAMTNNSWPATKKSVALGTYHTLTAKNGEYSIDGDTYTTPLLSSFNINATFLLFATRNEGGGVRYSKMSLKSFVCKHSGVKVMELIPVRIGTTGYLYDKVSGNLFGNDGTSDFVIGNDVT